MNNSNSDSPQVISSWDTFWQGTGDAEAYAAGGVSHPSIIAFWDKFFQAAEQEFESPRMVDLASGNGALVERALGQFGDHPISVHCVDVSESAIRNIKKRFPEIHGITGDLRNTELEQNSFEIVTSQFGVEYAGEDAILNALGLLAPGGFAVLMMHHEDGSIHRECELNLQAVQQVMDSEFLTLASEMFAAGFEAIKGADRGPYDAAALKLAPAVKALEEIMTEFGEDVADGTVASLYSDVGKIHSRIQHYDSGEVNNWLESMNTELEAYAIRMKSMAGAAIDKEQFAQLGEGAADLGLELLEAGPLYAPDEALPLAWVLLATKREDK